MSLHPSPPPPFQPFFASNSDWPRYGVRFILSDLTEQTNPRPICFQESGRATFSTTWTACSRIFIVLRRNTVWISTTSRTSPPFLSFSPPCLFGRSVPRKPCVPRFDEHFSTEQRWLGFCPYSAELSHVAELRCRCVLLLHTKIKID